MLFRKVKKAEEQLKVLQENLRQMEAVSVQNSEQEDNFEKEIHALTEQLKTVSKTICSVPKIKIFILYFWWRWVHKKINFEIFERIFFLHWFCLWDSNQSSRGVATIPPQPWKYFDKILWRNCQGATRFSSAYLVQLAEFEFGKMFRKFTSNARLRFFF